MIDATRILDLLVSGTTAEGQTPETHGNVVSGPGSQHTAAGAGDLLERARGMLGGVGNAIPGGFGGGLAGGVAAGAITSLLLGSKSGRKFAGEALKLGAAAALGGLAYRAYNNYRSGQPISASAPVNLGSATAAPTGSAVPSVPPRPLPAVTPANDHALVLVRAMIAAALSDGVIDADERHTIVGRLQAVGINSEEQQFLESEMTRPWSPAQFAAAVTVPEQRAEVYLASALAIDADTEAERTYLKYLAATLGLEDALIAHLTAAVDGAKAEAAGQGQLPGGERRAAG